MVPYLAGALWILSMAFMSPQESSVDKLVKQMRSERPDDQAHGRAELLKLGDKALPALRAELKRKPSESIEILIDDIEADARAVALPDKWPGGTYRYGTDFEDQGFRSSSNRRGPGNRLTLIDTIIRTIPDGYEVYKVVVIAEADRFFTPIRIEVTHNGKAQVQLDVTPGRIKGTWGDRKVDERVEGRITCPQSIVRAASVRRFVEGRPESLVEIQIPKVDFETRSVELKGLGPEDECLPEGPWAFLADHGAGQDSTITVGLDRSVTRWSGMTENYHSLNSVPADDADALFLPYATFTIGIEGKLPKVTDLKTIAGNCVVHFAPGFNDRQDGVRKLWINGDWLLLDAKGVHLNGKKLFEPGTRVQVTADWQNGTEVVKAPQDSTK